MPRTCLHKILHASFLQILPMAALNLFGLASTKFALKSTHKSCEGKF